MEHGTATMLGRYFVEPGREIPSKRGNPTPALASYGAYGVKSGLGATSKSMLEPGSTPRQGMNHDGYMQQEICPALKKSTGRR